MQVLDNPTPILFFTGKGGVGKTSLSCATAVALAKTLEEHWQRPVVPVFLIATEDHDTSEIVHQSPGKHDRLAERTLCHRFSLGYCRPFSRSYADAKRQCNHGYNGAQLNGAIYRYNYSYANPICRYN